MDVISAIVDAFTNYFVQLRATRIRFWLKPPVASFSELISLPITTLVFAAAFDRYWGLPNKTEFAGRLLVYLVVVLLVGGIACIWIKETADNISTNVRKFLSAALITSTVAAVFVVIDAWTHWIVEVEQFVQFIWGLGFPEAITASLPATLMALLLVTLIEHSLGVNESAKSAASWTKSFLMLAVASTLGLAIIIV